MIELLIFDVRSITIFGGGFLGSELAVALGNRGRKSDFQVIQAYQEAGNMGKVLPDYLSEWTTDKVRSEGVTVLPNTTVKAVTKGDSSNLKITMKNGKVVDTDHMVVAVSPSSVKHFKICPSSLQVGIEPDLELARASQLEVDPVHGGFKVVQLIINI